MQPLANHSSSRAWEREPRNAVGTYSGSKDRIFVGPWLTELSRVCRESPALQVLQNPSRAKQLTSCAVKPFVQNVLTTMIEYRSLNSYCFVVGNWGMALCPWVWCAVFFDYDQDFDRLQNDIDEVGNWSSINFLTLNRDKCKYMIVSRRKTVSTPSSPLLLEGHSLERVEMFKYLGVLLSHDLSWGEHVQAICSKARKILGLLYRRFYNNAPSSTLLQLYISLVRPHLDYASAIWSPYLSMHARIKLNLRTFKNLHVAWLLDYRTAVTKISLNLLTFQHLNAKGWKFGSVYTV